GSRSGPGGGPLSTASGTAASTWRTRSSRSAATRSASSARCLPHTAAATANARMAGVSRVPERISRSWPPPCSTGTGVTPRARISAPMPTGPPSLWPVTVSASGQLRGGLHRVGVERHAVLVGHRRELADRLYRAHLVVRPHHADHGHLVGSLRDRGPQRVGADRAVVADHEPDGLGALGFLQPAYRVQDCVVLDRGGQDPPPGAIPARPVQALHGEIVRLGPAAGEDDLARPG